MQVEDEYALRQAVDKSRKPSLDAFELTLMAVRATVDCQFRPLRISGTTRSSSYVS
jgi:hypothetical protein